MNKQLDVVCLGRIAVDLYGEQANTPLEDTRTFRRYPGGSSGNTAIAAARAGARVGLISAVGADPMGRYLRKYLAAENVDCRALTVRKERRTALAFLGMLGSEIDGLDYYRDNAADEWIEPSAVPGDYFNGVRYLALTGTNVADPSTWARVSPIVDAATRAGVEVVLDLDYRAALWSAFNGGLEGAITRVRAVLPCCKIVVGNLEEVALVIDGGACEGDFELVRKLGPDGASWRAGEAAPHQVAGHAIEVVNPVGAGDAFLGNLLASRVSGASRDEALRCANAAGAIVATRHGCASDMPFAEEISNFLGDPDQHSPALAHLHRSRARPRDRTRILALACDHREPFHQLMSEHGRSFEDARHFKSLVHRAMLAGGDLPTGYRAGMLMDPLFGQHVLNALGQDGVWTGRPVEVTGSRPLRLEPGANLAASIHSWRPGQVAKVLAWYSPDDPEALMRDQIETLHRLQAACRSASVEWMLELVPPAGKPRDDRTLRRGVQQCYEAGLMPDWWKLPALSTEDGWLKLSETIAAHDAQNRGVIVLGAAEPLEVMEDRLRSAGRQTICAGFAVGRTVFAEAARQWFAGQINDRSAVAAMQHNYSRLVGAFTTERTETCSA